MKDQNHIKQLFFKFLDDYDIFICTDRSGAGISLTRMSLLSAMWKMPYKYQLCLSEFIDMMTLPLSFDEEFYFASFREIRTGYWDTFAIIDNDGKEIVSWKQIFKWLEEFPLPKKQK
ncbi:MAG: hypothetical protein UT24_C0015G0014 [Candidatus Woesebacteria bacterium GW2011_GWB1_39_12]|uniref:Uncharacterized protein n=1 Tax=Candidatus Woesebacteria bacterium GW2011_GWB1_39_12 TaxID=1618574 RepID=A0A0G0MIM6_9BACT|nr:MAG: hypothetical protein UT24_C0015G0014 [Candidatus Woesebacteria bacterium GW2011_GWB1_39_12]